MRRLLVLVATLLIGSSAANAHGFGGFGMHMGGFGHMGGMHMSHGFGHMGGMHEHFGADREHFRDNEHRFPGDHSGHRGFERHGFSRMGNHMGDRNFDRRLDEFKSFHAGYRRVHHFRNDSGYDRSSGLNSEFNGLDILCPVASVASFVTPYVMPISLVCMFAD